jgi:hypothetical protein
MPFITNAIFMLISPFFVKVNIAVAVKGMLVNIAY